MDVDTITKHVSTRLRAARIAKGLTQEELAGRLGMATESISHIERGVTVPSLKTIAAMAEVLEIGVEEVFSGLNSDRKTGRKRAELEAQLRHLAIELSDKKLELVVQVATAIEHLE